jgi:RNA polymerase sigma factor (sigma-70 family)
MTNYFPDRDSADTGPGMSPAEAADHLRRWFTAHLRTVGRALAWFGVSLREDRAELTQDVFFAAYVALLRGEQIDAPRAWLRECARKHASNHRRKELRRRPSSGPSETAGDADHAGNADDPEQIASDRERLRRAFAGLDENAQDLVFDLRADEMSWGDVARERGITVDQARYLYQRAVTQMEEVLKRDDESEKERRSIGPPTLLARLDGALRDEADDVSPDTRRRIWSSLERRMSVAATEGASHFIEGKQRPHHPGLGRVRSWFWSLFT